MYFKFLGFAAVLALLAFATYADSFSFFLDVRPFKARSDLAPAALGEKKAMSISLFDAKEYLADVENYNNLIKTADEDEKNEKRWNELQWGSFHLRFSRYQDVRLQKDAEKPAERSNLREEISESPLRFFDLTNRETLEAMKRIFSPRLDLGLEF